MCAPGSRVPFWDLEWRGFVWEDCLLLPLGLLGLPPFPHGLRHGLHSYAALRLRTGCDVGSTPCVLARVRLSKTGYYLLDNTIQSILSWLKCAVNDKARWLQAWGQVESVARPPFSQRTRKRVGHRDRGGGRFCREHTKNPDPSLCSG